MKNPTDDYYEEYIQQASTIEHLRRNVYELQEQLQDQYKSKKELLNILFEKDQAFINNNISNSENPDCTEERQWGFFDVYYHEEAENWDTKLKRLVVEAGKKLSLQKHNLRSEYWFCAEGIADVSIFRDTVNSTKKITLTPGQSLCIPTKTWHQLCNNTSKRLVIIEIQYGERCVEEDIIRIDKEYSECHSQVMR